MGRLLLVRHGQSLWNRDGIVQGQDGPGLSERGHEQAALLGAWLADEAPDATLVSSDLVRCVETAAPYAAALDREPVVDVDLRERHFGSWQGVRHADLADRWPAHFDRFTRREDVVGEVGGESTPQLVARVLPALRRHAAAAPLTVVVTHGGPVWHGTHALLAVPEAMLGPVGNASVAELEVPEAGPVRLLGWNAVGHLPPSLRSTWHRPSPRSTTTPDRSVAASDGIT